MKFHRKFASGSLVVGKGGSSLTLHFPFPTKVLAITRGGKSFPQILFEKYFLPGRPVWVSSIAREMGVSPNPVERLMKKIEEAAESNPLLSGKRFVRAAPIGRGGATPVRFRQSKKSRLMPRQWAVIEKAARELWRKNPGAGTNDFRAACLSALEKAGLYEGNVVLSNRTITRLKKKAGIPLAVISPRDASVARELVRLSLLRGETPTNKAIAREFARYAKGRGMKTRLPSAYTLAKIRRGLGIGKSATARRPTRKEREVIRAAFLELAEKARKTGKAPSNKQISEHCMGALRERGLGEGIPRISPMTIYRMKKKSGLTRDYRQWR
jgi:transposase-like protein